MPNTVHFKNLNEHSFTFYLQNLLVQFNDSIIQIYLPSLPFLALFHLQVWYCIHELTLEFNFYIMIVAFHFIFMGCILLKGLYIIYIDLIYRYYFLFTRFLTYPAHFVFCMIFFVFLFIFKETEFKRRYLYYIWLFP